MPVKLEHLSGVKRPESQLLANGQSKPAIKDGTKVKLGSVFRTGSGHNYPAGSEGVKTGNYRYGWLVKMGDGATIVVPKHLNALIPLQ